MSVHGKHLISFTLQPRVDGEKLAGLLRAELAYTRARQLRLRCVHLLAGLALVVWLGACWPEQLPTPLPQVADIGWGLMLGVTVLAAVGEWNCHAHLSRWLAAIDGHTAPRVE